MTGTTSYDLALFALIAGMMIYQGRLYFRYRLAFRLAFFAFWFLLAAEFLSGVRWLAVPALACLAYGIWRRRRIGMNLERWMKDTGSSGEGLS